MDMPAPGLYSKAVALCCLFCPALWLDLHPIAMNTFIKNKPFEKTLDNLASRMEPAAPLAIPDRLLSVSSATKLANKVTE